MSDLNPLNLQQTAAVLGYLASAGRDAGRCLSSGGHRTSDGGGHPERAAVTPSRDGRTLILVVVLCIRLVQCVWLIAQRDPVVDGLTSLLWACALVTAFALVGLVLLAAIPAARSRPLWCRNWAMNSAESASPSQLR